MMSVTSFIGTETPTMQLLCNIDSNYGKIHQGGIIEDHNI